MERQLPTVKILDTDFIVDIKNQEFREKENPTNRISFDNIENNPDEVAIRYDKNTRNVFEGNWVGFLNADHTQLVHLPPLIELDRIGVLNGSVTLESDDQLISSREQQNNTKSQARVLPSIDIEGTTFILDMRLAEFRNQKDPRHRIQFGDLFLVGPGQVGFIYDPKTREAFYGSSFQLEQRDDLRLVELPSPVMMNADTSGKTFSSTSRSLKSETTSTQRQQLPKRKGRGL